MRQSNKVVIIFDDRELKATAKNEKAIYAILERQSEYARTVKLAQKEAEVVTELVGETQEIEEVSNTKHTGRRRDRRVPKPPKRLSEP